MHELRVAWRSLAKSPGVTLVAILTLALGIGANTAIFSVMEAAVLRPLPYPDASRLVVVHNVKDGDPLGPQSSSLPDYEDWRLERDVFERMALFTYWTFNLTERDVPLRLTAGRVTGEFFQTLGVDPLIGRTITAEDDRPDAAEVVVLSYSFWHGLFGGDDGVLGTTLMLNGRSHTVIGVMPKEFRFPGEDVALWAAVGDNMRGIERHNRFMLVVGRLGRNVTLFRAQEAMDLLSSRLEEEHPETNRGFRARLVSAHETLVSEIRPALTLLLASVSFVLLLACVNVSHLFLARAMARRRDAATRVALGANGKRLARQYLGESFLVATSGGVLGLGLALGATRALVGLYPGDIPRIDEAGLAPRVLAFTAAVTFATGLALGLVAALDAWKHARRHARGSGLRELEGARGHAAGNLFVTVQVAMALVLLTGSGLLLRSFWKLVHVSPGFHSERVLTLSVFLTPPKYRTLDDSFDYVTRSLERLEALPSVRSVAAVTDPPLGEGFLTMSVFAEGRPLAIAEAPDASFRGVSPDYFRVLGIRLLEGRTFDRGDDEDSEKVVVVNESFARRLFRDEEPLGRRIRWADPERDPTPLRIVGVVADVRHRGLDRDEGPVVYAPIEQITFFWLRWFTFALETGSDPHALTGVARDALLEVDRDQPVFQIQTLAAALASSFAERRFQLLLVELFAAVAVLLTALGVYGVVAHSVVHRTREVGLRSTLGARPRDILALFVGQGMRFTGLGLLAGLAGSVLVARLMSSLLFGIEPLDAATFASAPILLLGVALAAVFLPARRAAALDPARAIRRD